MNDLDNPTSTVLIIDFEKMCVTREIRKHPVKGWFLKETPLLMFCILYVL